MQAGIGSCADRRHRLRLGEDLGIRPDADFQILAPRALFDQNAFEVHCLLRARPELGKVLTDHADDFGANRRGRGRVAACLFLDDAFQHRYGEGDTGGLDRLQVDRRQQRRLPRIAIRRDAVRQNCIKRSDPLAA